MQETRLDAKFFESTRGRIVKLLRAASMTVAEIAGQLELTENGVRAHLLSLERDRLIEQKGLMKGFRKPHTLYGITAEARNLFPKPYAFLLNKLLTVLKSRLTPDEIRETMRDVGSEISATAGPGPADMNEKLDAALAALESMGGYARIEREPDGLTIASDACPFDEAVSEHPEVCGAAESMIEGIIGAKVSEHCDRTLLPKCRFKVDLFPTAE